jgi:hypothetical protein
MMLSATGTGLAWHSSGTARQPMLTHSVSRETSPSIPASGASKQNTGAESYRRRLSQLCVSSRPSAPEEAGVGHSRRGRTQELALPRCLKLLRTQSTAASHYRSIAKEGGVDPLRTRHASHRTCALSRTPTPRRPREGSHWAGGRMEAPAHQEAGLRHWLCRVPTTAFYRLATGIILQGTAGQWCVVLSCPDPAERCG